MIKKVLMYISILLISSTITGCWDRVELNDRAFVITLGIDKYEPKGDNVTDEDLEKRMVVTYEIAKLSGDGGGKEKDGGSDKMIKTVECNTLTSSVMDISSILDKRMYFGHLKLVVIGDEFLKERGLLKELVDSLERTAQIGRKVSVIAAKDIKAEELINEKLETQPLLGLYVNSLLDNNAKELSTIPVADVGELSAELVNQNGDVMIPLITKENEELKINGSALLRDYKLVGWFNSKETRSVIDSVNYTQLSVKYKDLYIPCVIYNSDVETTFTEKNNRLVTKFEVNAEGYLTEYKMEESINMFDDELIKYVEKKLNKLIEEEILDGTEKIQNVYNTDVKGLNYKLKKQDYELWKKYNKDWDEAYKNMQFEAEANVKVRRVGMLK